MVDRQTGRRATRIRQHRRPAWNHALTPVHLRHSQSTRREAFFNLRNDRRILSERETECLRHDLARQIVVGGPETAGEDHEIRA